MPLLRRVSNEKIKQVVARGSSTSEGTKHGKQSGKSDLSELYPAGEGASAAVTGSRACLKDRKYHQTLVAAHLRTSERAIMILPPDTHRPRIGEPFQQHN